MKHVLALLAGASLAALPVAFAGAQEAPPTPCNGMLYSDPKGDASYFDPTAPPGFSGPGNPNEDIRGLFFNYRDGVLTANIVVEKLDKTESGAAYATASKWEVGFVGPDDGEYFAKAVTDGAAWSFEMEKIERVGTGAPVDPATDFITTPTKGAAFEGPMGVLSIEIPSAIGIKPGAELRAVDVTAIPRESVQQPGLFTDTAPDADPKAYKIVECPAEQTSTTDTTGTTTTTTTTPQPQPTPTQPQPTPTPAPAPQGPPAPGSPLPATGTLTADAAADKGKRKTAAKRGLRARVRCSVQCKVKATATVTKSTARKLKLGRKAMKIGTGKASITKAGRIPFYVKMTKKAKRALKRKGVKKFALKVAFTVTDMQGGQAKKFTKKSTLR